MKLMHLLVAFGASGVRGPRKRGATGTKNDETIHDAAAVSSVTADRKVCRNRNFPTRSASGGKSADQFLSTIARNRSRHY